MNGSRSAIRCLRLCAPTSQRASKLICGAEPEAVGGWRDVLGELPQRIHERMPRLAAEAVVGADAFLAWLGPPPPGWNPMRG